MRIGFRLAIHVTYDTSGFIANAPHTQSTIKFTSEGSPPIKALVLTADLEGFSRFFSQPDVHLYVPRFLNHVFAALNLSFRGGVIPWLEEKKKKPTPAHGFPKPIHSKFQGDGALYIWEYNDAFNVGEFFCMLDLFQMNYSKIISTCIHDIPVADIPSRIRFGLAAGSIYRLEYEDHSDTEYIGYAINLASRLQKYCPELGFIASARVELPDKFFKRHVIRVVAKKLKGFPKEVVIVDKQAFESLKSAVKKKLFDVPSTNATTRHL